MECIVPVSFSLFQSIPVVSHPSSSLLVAPRRPRSNSHEISSAPLLLPLPRTRHDPPNAYDDLTNRRTHNDHHGLTNARDSSSRTPTIT